MYISHAPHYLLFFSAQLKSEPDVETLSCQLEAFGELLGHGKGCESARLTPEQVRNACRFRWIYIYMYIYIYVCVCVYVYIICVCVFVCVYAE